MIPKELIFQAQILDINTFLGMAEKKSNAFDSESGPGFVVTSMSFGLAANVYQVDVEEQLHFFFQKAAMHMYLLFPIITKKSQIF